jgi:hypothetical protein
MNLNLMRAETVVVNAHWALYCDNYLEGFHIPFVHEDLDAALIMAKVILFCTIIVIFKLLQRSLKRF